MKREVEIIISKDGTEITLEGKNFKGSSCHDVLDKIRKKIGRLVSSRKKDEFYTPDEKVKGQIRH